LAKNENNSSPKKVDSKTSVVNLSLNIIIFFLASLTIYLGYSIIIKLNDKPKMVEEVENLKNQPAEIIQVEVLNGCGISGVADRFTDFLRNKNVDVVNIGNYSSFDIEETFVIDRVGNKANAFKVADFLGISRKSNSITQLNEDLFLDVTIVIGKDYYKLNPLK
jgi:hypothetical protein